MLTGPSGGLVTVTNHGPRPLRVQLRLPTGAHDATSAEPDGATPLALDGGSAQLELPAHGAAVVAWRGGDIGRAGNR
jgi:hypothetical protein